MSSTRTLYSRLTISVLAAPTSAGRRTISAPQYLPSAMIGVLHLLFWSPSWSFRPSWYHLNYFGHLIQVSHQSLGFPFSSAGFEVFDLRPGYLSKNTDLNEFDANSTFLAYHLCLGTLQVLNLRTALFPRCLVVVFFPPFHPLISSSLCTSAASMEPLALLWTRPPSFDASRQWVRSHGSRIRFIFPSPAIRNLLPLFCLNLFWFDTCMIWPVLVMLPIPLCGWLKGAPPGLPKQHRAKKNVACLRLLAWSWMLQLA